MKPVNNYTPGVIKKWAYRKTASKIPHFLQELDTVIKHSQLLFSLLADKFCPQRAQILNSLYFLVGQAVSKHNPEDLNHVINLLNTASSYEEKIILNWISRSKIILHDLRKYDYVEWCDGGFVKKDIQLLNSNITIPH